MKIKTAPIVEAIHDFESQLNTVMEKIEIDVQTQFTSLNHFQEDLEELKYQLSKLESSLAEYTPVVETGADRAIRQREEASV